MNINKDPLYLTPRDSSIEEEVLKCKVKGNFISKAEMDKEVKKSEPKLSKKSVEREAYDKRRQINGTNRFPEKLKFEDD